MQASLLDKIAARAIHQEGRKKDWWPFATEEAFFDHYKKHGTRLRGNADFVVVGLLANQDLAIREYRSIQEVADLSEQSFTLPYSLLTERLIDEHQH